MCKIVELFAKLGDTSVLANSERDEGESEKYDSAKLSLLRCLFLEIFNCVFSLSASQLFLKSLVCLFEGSIAGNLLSAAHKPPSNQQYDGCQFQNGHPQSLRQTMAKSWRMVSGQREEVRTRGRPQCLQVVCNIGGEGVRLT